MRAYRHLRSFLKALPSKAVRVDVVICVEDGGKRVLTGFSKGSQDWTDLTRELGQVLDLLALMERGAIEPGDILDMVAVGLTPPSP